MTWTAKPSGPVAQVVFALDGNTTTFTDTSAPYEYVLDTTTLANGAHRLGLTVTTLYGDRVVWAPYQIGTVTVANAPTAPAPAGSGGVGGLRRRGRRQFWRCGPVSDGLGRADRCAGGRHADVASTGPATTRTTGRRRAST